MTAPFIFAGNALRKAILIHGFASPTWSAARFDGGKTISEDGLVYVVSRYSARETMDRLLAALPAGSMTVFARVDHAAGAAAVGMPLRPTNLVIFGNPKGGTPLMQEEQRAGIDLPLKALVWEDADGKVWVSCNDAAWIARRHGVGHVAAVEAMTAALQAIVQAATG